MSVAARPSSGAAAARLGAPQLSCWNCRYFCRDPREIEAQLPGMRSLGSALGSVRATDGICSVHERYLDPSSTCASHELEAVATPLATGSGAIQNIDLNKLGGPVSVVIERIGT
jgi:hypothetical protein